MDHPVRRVEPHAFDWSTGNGVAAELHALLDRAEAEDGAAPLDEAALLNLIGSGSDRQ